jgi:hypothetical protein
MLFFKDTISKNNFLTPLFFWWFERNGRQGGALLRFLCGPRRAGGGLGPGYRWSNCGRELKKTYLNMDMSKNILLFQWLTIINHRLTIDYPGKLWGVEFIELYKDKKWPVKSLWTLVLHCENSSGGAWLQSSIPGHPELIAQVARRNMWEVDGFLVDLWSPTEL